MNIVTLLASDQETASGDVFNFQRDITRNRSGIFQVSGIDAGSAIVTLFGRLTPDSDWATVVTLTGDDARACLIFPEMYAYITSSSENDVLVQLGA